MSATPALNPFAAGRVLWAALLLLSATLLILLATDAWLRGDRTKPPELTRLAKAIGLGMPAMLPSAHPAGHRAISPQRAAGRFGPGLPPASDDLADLLLAPPGEPR